MSNIWTYIQNATGYDRAAIKEMVFCFCYGGLGDKTLFDVARRHKFDLEAIGKIRGAADEWLKGEASDDFIKEVMAAARRQMRRGTG